MSASDPKRGEESRRDSGTRGSIAHGVAAQAGMAQARTDAELAFADKALATARTDQAKARAEELKQKATAKAAEAGTQLDRATAVNTCVPIGLSGLRILTGTRATARAWARACAGRR